jgi:hypothetical protein
LIASVRSKNVLACSRISLAILCDISTLRHRFGCPTSFRDRVCADVMDEDILPKWPSINTR